MAKSENVLHPSNESIWLDIKKEMEFDIIRGRYKTNDLLPSIMKAKDIYGCGKTTSQKVLEELCKEGISRKEQGKGYFLKAYAKEKLIEKYSNQFESELEIVIRDANDLMIDRKDLEIIIANKIAEIYDKK